MVSNFQFTNPVLANLEFKFNEQFDVDSGEINIQTHVEIKISKEDSETEAVVRLEIIIGSDDSEMPFYLKAEETAHFRWDEGIYSDDDIDALLSQNAPALLLAYLRPIVATVTNSSPVGSYNIPFINFAGK